MVYDIYLPLLDGACIIPEDAKICRIHKTVEGLAVNGHLIETVEIDENTLDLCVSVEYSKGMPVFVGDDLKINGGKNPTVLVVKEK